MIINLVILQSDQSTAGRAFGLEQANSLGFAVFIVGLMLMLLLVIHWYRQKAKIEKKGKPGGKTNRFSQIDGVSQLEFMTKNELRQMIIKERERKEAEGEVEDISGAGSVAEALIVADIVPEKKPEPSSELNLFDDQVLSAGIGKVKDESGGVENEAEEPVQPVKRPVKNPYTDKIERTPLSTEFPEDFKKGSRKI